METNNLVRNYTAKAAQATLLRSVYLWMTLALIITGFVAMYVAKSYTLVNMMIQNSMMFWGVLIAEVALVWYLSARIYKMSFTTATIYSLLYIKWCNPLHSTACLHGKFHCNYILCHSWNIRHHGHLWLHNQKRFNPHRKSLYHGSNRNYHSFAG